MAHMWKMKNVYKILVKKPEGMRHRHKWEDDIRLDLKEIGWDGMD
jgi:hypothetical protein